MAGILQSRLHLHMAAHDQEAARHRTHSLPRQDRLLRPALHLRPCDELRVAQQHGGEPGAAEEEADPEEDGGSGFIL